MAEDSPEHESQLGLSARNCRERLLFAVVSWSVRGRRLESLTCLAVAGCVALGGDPTTRAAAQSTAGRAKPALAASGRPGTGRPEVPIDASAAETGAVSIRLPDSRPPPTAGVVTALSAAETAALIERLEPLPDVASGRGAPAIRPATTPRLVQDLCARSRSWCRAASR